MASIKLERPLPPTPPLSDDEQSPRLFCHLPDVLSKLSNPQLRYERKMGDTELSYFLPSRQSGVNDMYLHLGFRAAEQFVRRSRVATVWAILRLRHPLLAATVEMHDYDDVRFVYSAPTNVDDALADANSNLEYRDHSKDVLIDSYLNGPRTLSNSRLSYLIVSSPSSHSIPTPPLTPTSAEELATDLQPAVERPEDKQHDILICAMHFLGDGMALHAFANDFFGLLGSEKSDSELKLQLVDEWEMRWGSPAHDTSILPRSLEENMPVKWTRIRRAAARVDFLMSQEELVGGQVFPRRKHPERHTVVPTVSFPTDRTKAMLKKCKSNGVSISAALFAVCNVAWARMGGGRKELPIMMYSALNLRPYFTVKQPSPWDSYWFLAIGYFNVILPNFLPQDGDKVEAIFWHRARQAKEQSTVAAKHPLVVSRTHEMARERGKRARRWGKEDDEKEKGTWTPPCPPSTSSPPLEPVLPARAESSSTALLGLSLLGNLDGIYKHANFPSIRMHTLTTGSRQRHGAMLLFGYTFAGKLWVSLGYDENGFAGDVVDSFWAELIGCMEEFLG
ncbi:unnamed protein product [Somion occarium]|uniref:Uncharacterized protein n=2 Tax=Somion occarium TaxID=3059160 RepID=A0ABP1CH63_9APHY